MADYELPNGTILKLLSPEEHARQIDRIVATIRRSQRPPNSFHPTGDAETDTGGNLAFTPLYRVPQGMIAVVHRINTEADGYTRGSPLTSGYLSFSVNAGGKHDIFVGLPASPSGATAPASIVDSVSAGQICKDGDVVGVAGGSLPDSTWFHFRLQVLLWETEGGAVEPSGS